MKDSLLKYILLATGVFWLAAILTCCREDRQDNSWMNQDFTIDESLTASSGDSVDLILKKAMAHNNRFSTFATNLNIKVRLDNYTLGFSGQLRIKKDEIIWISAQKFMFEIFRLKMMPDTLLFYSKIADMASIYVQDSAEDLLNKSYSLLQCLFMQQVDSVMFQGERSLSCDSANWIIHGVYEDSVAWQLYLKKEDFRPDGINIQVRENQSELQLSVRYMDSNGFEVSLSQNRKLTMQAQVNYTKIRWNENLSYPLSFPDGIRVEMNHGLFNTLEKSRENSINIE